jgi:hypothetical protein
VARARASVFAILALGLCTASACTLLTDTDGLSNDATAVDEGGREAGGSETAPLDGTTDGTVMEAGGDGAATSAYAKAVLADTPLLYYRFGEQDGTPARDEVSGTSVPYPVQGVTLGVAGALTGDPSTALRLDGTGNIQLPQDTDFEGMAAFSVEAWVSRDASGGNGVGFLVDHQAWSDGRRGWDLLADSNGFTFERTITVDGGTSFNSSYTGETAVVGVWNHLVGTFDGTTMRLYVDAVRRNTYTASIALSKIGVPFAVGKQNCTPCANTGYYGALDELAIYKQALSEARILAHFNAGKAL